MIESKARLTNAVKDYKSGKYHVTFEFDSMDEDSIDTIQKNELRVNIDKWRERRTPEQNSYLWEIYTKMAMVLETSKDEVHETMLQDYPIAYKDDKGIVVVTLSAKRDVSTLSGHWRFFKESPDGKFKSYYRIKGTSDMNTAEMAWFIDRVLEEASILGIQVETPDRKAEAERWLNQS